MRGGVSDPFYMLQFLEESSPHAWGCFLQDFRLRRGWVVFPTCVGVFPELTQAQGELKGLPHMRGGVSCGMIVRSTEPWSSPHAWGCFLFFINLPRRYTVFPTCVGVFLLPGFFCWGRIGLPHMRGGVSQTSHRPEMASRSSPHAWGCFSSETGQNSKATVFPTCVGVFPGHPTFPDTSPSLPHMRGGVSSGRSRYSFN